MGGCGKGRTRITITTAVLVALGTGVSGLVSQAIADTGAAVSTSARDGIYLYGESKVSHQLGKGYLIFQQSGQQLVGAIYYPQSEYTCFMGQHTATHLNLQPFEPDGQPSTAFQVARPQLHQIPAIGASERQVLAACQAEVVALQSSRAITALPHP